MTENIYKEKINYKSIRIIDRKPKWVIVDENGKIINRNPTKEELKLCKSLEENRNFKYKNEEELLDYMRQFKKDNGRVPIKTDFINNPKYPSCATYQRHFGSWNLAIEMSGLLDNTQIRQVIRHTNEELLEYLLQFYKENGRPPVRRDFENYHKYPGFSTYQRHFGSWNNALKLVGLDLDSTVIKGTLKNTNQKARLAEIFVLEHFVDKDRAIDLSGENHGSFADGICPKKQIYDVKSSKFYSRGYWMFVLDKIIDFYYLLAFNDDWTELLYAWRISGDEMDIHNMQNRLYISINGRYSIENMKKYEITDKFMNAFNNWKENNNKL